MSKAGTELEKLVALIEETLVHDGMRVETNKRLFTEDGRQRAEFDVVVTGKVGSTDFRWLIECRDRASAAPVSWIEQLVGRRQGYGFDRVTAVSASGFSAAAQSFAGTHGVELREVSKLDAADLSTWIAPEGAFVSRSRTTCVQTAFVLISSDTPEHLQIALANTWRGEGPRDRAVLRVRGTDTFHTLDQAFLAAVTNVGTLFDDVKENGADKILNLEVSYPNGDYELVAEDGSAVVHKINFRGELRVRTQVAPMSKMLDYRTLGASEPISQTAAFTVDGPHDHPLTVEFHRVQQSGNTRIVLRVGPKSGTNRHPSSAPR